MSGSCTREWWQGKLHTGGRGLVEVHARNCATTKACSSFAVVTRRDALNLSDSTSPTRATRLRTQRSLARSLPSKGEAPARISCFPSTYFPLHSLSTLSLSLLFTSSLLSNTLSALHHLSRLHNVHHVKATSLRFSPCPGWPLGQRHQRTLPPSACA